MPFFSNIESLVLFAGKMPTATTPSNENRLKNFKNKGKDNDELRRRRNEVGELLVAGNETYYRNFEPSFFFF